MQLLYWQNPSSTAGTHDHGAGAQVRHLMGTPHLPQASYLLGIPVEVQIRHDFPRVLTGDGATHAQDLASQHPPHQTHRMGSLQQRKARKVCCKAKPFKTPFFFERAKDFFGPSPMFLLGKRKTRLANVQTSVLGLKGQLFEFPVTLSALRRNRSTLLPPASEFAVYSTA